MGHLVLGNCGNHPKCESALSARVEGVRLLGEVPFSEDDYARLKSLVKTLFSGDMTQGTDVLQNETPVCLAFFLVWSGILYYREGDYWSSISDEVPGLDPQWQTTWGSCFISFLESKGLPSFDVPGSHRYVTPILLHGMIPDSCLDEYFKSLLYPLVTRDLVNLDDRGEIRFWLKQKREDHENRGKLEDETDSLKQRRSEIELAIRRYRLLADAWSNLGELEKLESEAGNMEELDRLPAQIGEWRTGNEQTRRRFQEELDRREKEKQRLEPAAGEYSEADRKFLESQPEIRRWVDILPRIEQLQAQERELYKRSEASCRKLTDVADSILTDRWTEEIGKTIQELPFAVLEEKVGRLARQADRRRSTDGWQPLIVKLRRIWSFIRSLFPEAEPHQQLPGGLQVAGREASEEQKRLVQDIEKILQALPVKTMEYSRAGPEFVQRLKQFGNIYSEYLRNRTAYETARRELEKERSVITSLAESLGLAPTDEICGLVKALEEGLAEAGKRKEKTEAAHEKIQSIEEHVKKLRAEQEVKCEESAAVDEILAVLGEGDIDLGLLRVDQRRKAHRKADELRAGLVSMLEVKTGVLDSLLQEKLAADRAGRDAKHHRSETARLERELAEVGETIVARERAMEKIPPPFAYENKPIGRFFLYAEELACEYLFQSARLLGHRLGYLPAGRPPDIKLPPRIIVKFDNWWDRFREEGSGDQAETEPSNDGLTMLCRGPEIYLDEARGEVKVHFPAQRRLPRPEEDHRAHLILEGGKDHSNLSGSGLWKEVRRIRLFVSTEKTVESEELSCFSLSFPADIYEFSFRFDNRIAKSWSFPGLTPEHPYLAFKDSSSRKQMIIPQPEGLPRGNMWLLVRGASTIVSGAEIIEECPLYGKWRGFKCLKIEAAEAAPLIITDAAGQKIQIQISQERSIVPQLHGGQRLENCRSDGVDIYVGAPPDLSFPVENRDDVSDWLLSVHPTPGLDSTCEKGIFLKLGELGTALGFSDGGDRVCIRLSDSRLLGPEPIGHFTVRLKKRSGKADWRARFCSVPSFQAKFEKDIYCLIQEDEDSPVVMTLSDLGGAVFKPRRPAKISNRLAGNCVRIETGLSESDITGLLEYKLTGKLRIKVPLMIGIPRLTWRIDGWPDDGYADETSRVEELWFGDWQDAGESLTLILNIPETVEGTGFLRLQGTEHEVRESIKNGQVRFNLLGFNDSLRAAVGQLTPLVFTVYGAGPVIEEAKIVDVRTKWEVGGLECYQDDDEDGTKILNIMWQEEMGKPEGVRKVRLWNVLNPAGVPHHVADVSEGKKSVEIHGRDVELCPKQKYRLQVIVETPQFEEEFGMPSRDALNTKDIEVEKEILKGRAVFKDVVDTHGSSWEINDGYAVQLKGMRIDDSIKKVKPTDEKDIPVIDESDSSKASYRSEEEVLFKPGNRGWYIGKISVNLPAEKRLFANANPVKIEIKQGHVIQAIEDRSGDGMCYCISCRELFFEKKCLHCGDERGIKCIDETNDGLRIKFALEKSSD